MHKITYRLSNGKDCNTIHATIIEETETKIKVLVNNEVERWINKERIVSNEKII